MFLLAFPANSGSQEIAHGTAETGADGSFKIQFIAKPDLAVAEKDEPIFRYQVSADVTDTNGETRSAERGIEAGYTALRASLSASDWLTSGKPVEIKLTTTTLDGEPQKAEGALKIYRLKQPEKVPAGYPRPTAGLPRRSVAERRKRIPSPSAVLARERRR